jgi:hypothetical protein
MGTPKKATIGNCEKGHAFKKLETGRYRGSGPDHKLVKTEKAKPSANPCGCKCAACKKCTRMHKGFGTRVINTYTKATYIKLFCSRCGLTIDQVVDDRDGEFTREESENFRT